MCAKAYSYKALCMHYLPMMVLIIKHLRCVMRVKGFQLHVYWALEINWTVINNNLTTLLKSPAWAASRNTSLHSSVFSTPFEPYLPQLFTFEMDACTLEILAVLNNCSLRCGEEVLLIDSVPFMTVSFFTGPLGWNVLNAEFWLVGKVCDWCDWFLVAALFSSFANSAWMLSREAVLATEL